MVIHQHYEVRDALRELGVDEKTLKAVVENAQAARNTATLHHPRGAGGQLAYLDGVRALRDRYVPLGWEKQNPSNFELTVNPETGIAIAFAGGDKNTGNVDSEPRTKTPKGWMTKLALEPAQTTLDLGIDFGNAQIESGEDAYVLPYETWFLLHYADVDEVRSELSRPSHMDANNYVVGWSRRVILNAIPLDPDTVHRTSADDVDDDIDIDVVRRT